MLPLYAQPTLRRGHAASYRFRHYRLSCLSHTAIRSLLTLLAFVHIALISTSSAQDCKYSPYWGEDGELWDPNGPLKDYSDVGYHGGNQPIPYQQRSASKTFGAGRFTITNPIIITKGVLRGAGKDKTILYFPKGLIGMGRIDMCAKGGNAGHCDWDLGVINATGSEIGIEDLTVEFPPHSYRHHNGQGFNGPMLHDCTNCWIKNVKVINADEGFAIFYGGQNTIDSVEVIGGYHNYIHMTLTQNNLVTNFRVSGGSIHGLSGNWSAHGGVYSNGWGNPVVIEPNHNGPTTTGLLYSNIQGTGGKKKKLSDTFLWNYMKQDLCPLDIHQAQLAKRLGIDMTAIADAGPDQTVLVGQVVARDGEGGSAPVGDALTFQGNFGDGRTSTQAMITRSYAEVDAYTVGVTVSDGSQLDNFSYQFDVASGEYDVTLHFAEVHRKGPDKRLFDVYIEDMLVLDNYDSHAAAFLTFPGIVVDDGQLTIDFVAGKDDAVISAIER